MNKPLRRKKLFTWAIGLSVAVCIVALIVLLPFMYRSPLDEANISQPEMSKYRGASEDISVISDLMSKPDYDGALVSTEKALQKQMNQLKEFKDLPQDYYDDEMAYEEEHDRLMEAELRWTYIYLLVKAERNKDAIKELKTYLKNKEYAEHAEEAESLLAVLKGNGGSKKIIPNEGEKSFNYWAGFWKDVF